MTKIDIIKIVYAGISRCAKKHAINKQQEQEFLQEGLIAACECIDKYKDKREDEIILIIGKAALNRIIKKQREEINWTRRNLTKTIKVDRPIDNWDLDSDVDIDDIDNNDINFSIIDEREFILIMLSFLSINGKMILKEKINPSIKTMNVMLNEKREKLIKHKSGKLVMNLYTDKITDSHISKSLGISKATVSREVNRIKEVTLYLLHGLNDTNYQ